MTLFGEAFMIGLGAALGVYTVMCPLQCLGCMAYYGSRTPKP